MARYYRRRYTRTIVRAPKKKWCSNILDINLNTTGTTTTVTPPNYDSNYTTLVENKSETTSPTPVIIKTGNFKLQADLYFDGAASGSSVVATLYIAYVPQGWSLTPTSSAASLVANHPEWIMAWRVLESGYVDGNNSLVDSNRFTMSSRLKRNLNSGDSVAAIVIYDNLLAGAVGHIKGKCQFWTCAN